MIYLVWLVTGAAVALALGAGQLRRARSVAGRSSVMAGAFGGLVGGVLCDGVAGISHHTLSVSSMIGAIVLALLMCLVLQSRVSDVEQ